jgi:cytochrome d ubiquinol oxidase subunit I
VTDLMAARSQMAISLGFHMIFAVVGMGMPVLMVAADALAAWTGDRTWEELAYRWGKGTAITFAVGAVSGTVLSFELGLSWPGFMAFAGPIVGLPFSLEGFAFFFEAICLGIVLYGRDRVPRWGHLLAGVGVAVSGAASGAFVVTANAWMNTPTGYTLGPDGSVVDVDPVAAMLNPSALGQVLHMVVAAWLATGWTVAGIHAWLLLREPGSAGRAFHHKGLAAALVLAVGFTFLQPLTGHVIAEAVAHNQPVKLAALEARWETGPRAAFTVLGWPDEEAEVTRWGLEIPGLLSILAAGDVNAVVSGLSEVPRSERPPVAVVHAAYQLMLATAAGMGFTGAVALGLVAWRRRLPDDRWFLWLVVATSPLGIVGIEAGWTATEVGRQPWVIQGVLRTADAVTPMPGLPVPLAVFVGLYVLLGLACALLLRRQFLHAPDAEVAP